MQSPTRRRAPSLLASRWAFAVLALALVATPSPADALEGLSGVVAADDEAGPDALFVGRTDAFIVAFGRHGVAHVPRGGGEALRLAFLGANPDPEVVAVDPLPGQVHIVRGADPAAWRHGLTRFAGVRYRDLYPGVDLELRLADGRLKRDLLVAPGADPAAIAFRYDGADGLTLGPDGALHIDTGAALITDAAPLAWQERHGARDLVAVDYRVDPVTGDVSFELGPYDPALPLIIDPALDFAAYVGGDGFDEVNAVQTDAQGNIYLVGATSSVDFPATSGALNTNTLSGKTFVSSDAFAMKLDRDGRLLWATFFGGKTDRFPHSLCLDPDPPPGEAPTCNFPIASPWGLGGVDAALALAVDSDGSVYVAGQTNAIDMPVIPTANGVQTQLSNRPFDPTTPQMSRDFDAFLLYLNPAGIADYATYFGGSRTDIARAVAIDSARRVWIAGVTASADLPTRDPLHPYRGGPAGLSDDDTDAFVAQIAVDRVDPTLSRLVFATHLGGVGYDEATALVADPGGAGGVVVAGTTAAPDFPTASHVGGAAAARGGEDGFVVILREDAAGKPQLFARTLIGGLGDDEVHAIALIPGTQLRLAVVGATTTPASHFTDCLPTNGCGSDGACDLDLLGPKDDGFVLTLLSQAEGAPACASMRYLGGEARDEVNAVAVDPSTGEIYVAGTTWSADFPTTAAHQRHKADGRSTGCLASDPFDCADNSDAFFARLTPQGTALMNATFLGGTGTGATTDDAGRGVAFGGGVTGDRYALVVGQTHSDDFPNQGALLPQPLLTRDVANGMLVRLPVDVADVVVAFVTATPSSVETGATTVYRVRVNNDGPASAPIRIKADMGGIGFIAPGPGCTYDGATEAMTCFDPAAVAPGDGREFTATITAPPGPTVLSHSFVATSSVRDPELSNNQKVLTVVVGGASLVFTGATCAPAKVGFDRAFDCTLTVKNDGPEPAESVEAVLRYVPAATGQELTLDFASPTACTQTTTGGLEIRCPVAAALAKGASATVTARLRTPAPTAEFDARLTLTTAATTPSGVVRPDTRSAVVQVRNADLELAATATPDPVGLGRPITYTATVKNLGPGDVVDPRVTIQLSHALVPTADSDPRCLQVTPLSYLCRAAVTGAPLTLAENQTQTWVFEVTAPATASVVDAVAVAASAHPDPPANNRRALKTHVGWADVEVRSVTVTAPSVPPYGRLRDVTVEAVIANKTADVAANNVIVEYTADTSATPHTGATYTLTTAAGATALGTAPCTAGPPLRCVIPNLNSLTPGFDTATLTITTRPVRAGIHTHRFRIVGADEMDPVTANNTGETMHLVLGHDLGLTATTTLTSFIRGEAGRFTLNVANGALGGDAEASTLRVTYAADDWTWSGLASHSQGLTCPAPATPGVVTCAIGPLSAGAGALLGVDLTPKRKGPLSLTFALEGPLQGDDRDRSNEVRAVSMPVEVSDLVLGVAAPAPVAVGEKVVYPVTVQNIGVAKSDGWQVIHTFPADRLELDLAATPPGFTCGAAAGKTTCSGAELPAGMASATAVPLTYTAKKSGDFDSTLLLKDGTGVANDDMDLSNNSETVATKILGPDVRLVNQRQDLTNPVGWQRTVLYHFDVENPSFAEDTGDFSVTFVLFGAEKRSRIVLASLGGLQSRCTIDTATAVQVTCNNPGGLPKRPTGSAPPRVEVVVHTVGLGRGEVVANAFLTPTKPDPDTANNQFRPGPVTTVREGFDLVPHLVPDPFIRNRGTTTDPYTMTITNTREGRANAVTLQQQAIFGHLRFKSATATQGQGCDNREPPGEVFCRLGDLEKGQSVTVTFEMDAIKEGVEPIRYFVHSTHPDNEENRADNNPTSSQRVAGANLVTRTTWPSDTLAQGQTVDLAVTVTNEAPLGGTTPPRSLPATLKHTGFAPHLKLVASSVGAPSGGAACSSAAGVTTCALGELDGGQAVVVHLRYEADAPGTFTHQLAGAEPSGTADEVPADNVITHTDTVDGADLVLEQIVVDARVGVGRGAPFAVAVRNASTTVLAEG